MSWRILAATGTLALLLGSAGAVRAQDTPTSSKEGSADSKGASQQAAVDTKTTSKPAAKKAKAATASKAKSSKSNSRSKSEKSTSSDETEPKYELATFGGGCFWHVEADFERLNGVVSAVSGYAGGNIRNPNYEMVHEGFTGHAEVVMVQYDPEIISYEDLLKVFWQIHDPTTLNRQGPDIGTQYRSIILYHNEEQRKAALKSYDQLVSARVFRSPIVTQLVPLKAFYRAEDEHQDYYGGKPRARTTRRTTKARSRKPMSKVARALSKKPEDAAAEAKPADQKDDAGAKSSGDSAAPPGAEAKP